MKFLFIFKECYYTTSRYSLPSPYETNGSDTPRLKSFIISKTILLCQKANPAFIFIK